MIIVTGGAGLIGSALVAELNERGENDILIVDAVDHERKARNLSPLQFTRLVEIGAFREDLKSGGYDNEGIRGILHMGACSNTTEKNWDYLQDNNVDFTKELIVWCEKHDARCVFASSAATYGDGSLGFSDNPSLFDSLVPLNLYGKSKLDVDIWARDEGYLETSAGVRYFNVFGPNEWHKEGMRSVVNKKFPEIRDGKPFTLFKSYDSGYADGDQERDFIYVKDAADATLWLFENPHANGIFNVGTGLARTWNDLAKAMYKAMEVSEKIDYIEMPETLKNQYQYHTQADITRLRTAGYGENIRTLEEAIDDYIKRYLVPDRHLGEI